MPIRKEKPWQENASQKVVGSNPSGGKVLNFVKSLAKSHFMMTALWNLQTFLS